MPRQFFLTCLLQGTALSLYVFIKAKQRINEQFTNEPASIGPGLWLVVGGLAAQLFAVLLLGGSLPPSRAKIIEEYVDEDLPDHAPAPSMTHTSEKGLVNDYYGQNQQEPYQEYTLPDLNLYNSKSFSGYPQADSYQTEQPRFEVEPQQQYDSSTYYNNQSEAQHYNEAQAYNSTYQPGPMVLDERYADEQQVPVARAKSQRTHRSHRSRQY